MNLIKETNSILISHQAFSISLILENIFSHVTLRKDILPFCLVNRWWNKLATERLWYKFQGLKNDQKTGAFSKFLKILQRSNLYYNDPITNADKRSIHQYGRYVKVLDLEKLKIDHYKLLETLDCCPRIEQFSLGNIKLNKVQLYDISKRLPELRLFKFNDIEINDGKALGAIAMYCLMLEELNLKKDIACDPNVLLDITKYCKRLTKLELVEKYYEDEILLPCLSNCPNLTFLNIHRCISISESFLLSIFKSCPKLTNVIVENVSDITTEFAIETFKHFRNFKVLSIQYVERYLESKIKANESSINVNLYNAELGRIIDYFKKDDDDEMKPRHVLKELALVDVPLNKLNLEIICKGLDQLTRLELSGVQGLSKYVSFSLNLIIFSSVPEPLLKEESNQLFKNCSQLENIQWQLQRFSRND
ncbi:8534_t:CDS:2 [Funneliformis geosporum]|uniref:19574_t:CDS:1 n=1 Tax=Funneliformis geosporum TaxID=1117311 RepID=A0A9W4SXG3_9GLOM|nr:19574_t:CDS:2 [Funneliformis geosporum]CAI2184590.1 8534_t:CDS:2 [Funneliformis geosporum]